MVPVVPPAVAIRMLEHEQARRTDLSSIQRLVLGGQRPSTELIERLDRELGIRALQMFGMAEGMFLYTPPDAPEQARLTTVGTPISPVDEVRVLDIGGEEEVPNGTLGELACRGPYTINGYYRAPQHNASSFTSDGFYRTGDLVTRHVLAGRDYYAIDGRIKDVINRGAEKIHAEEVEELLVRHPDVRNAALVAMPDPVLGERICAYLVAHEDAEEPTTASSGRFLLEQGLAKFKLPERVELVEAIPLTNVGKVSKKDLRADIEKKIEKESVALRLDSIAVLGGGPGGLYAARLLKMAHPHATVRVHEQDLPENTFGFGVAVAGRTQRNLEEADPATQADITAAGRPHDMRMIVGDQAARVHNGPLIGIARTELLAVLDRHARAAGVELHYGERRRLEDIDADLVVVADGVSSQTRTEHAEDFGADVEVAGGLYLWAGADFALETAIFAPVTTAHGAFVTHAYPYAPNRSTFLIETDEATWRAAGFDVTREATAPDASDTAALAYLERAFAEYLDGHHLIGNRTRWSRFRTVRCRRWTRGNAVLLGDAAHTAHYSVGSGTKLAMEDAIALRNAVADADDLPTALATYERERRPQVERLQELARRSRLWWDSFPRRTALPVDQLMIAYMTRTGNVGLQRFAGTNPDIVRRGLAQFADLDPSHVPTEGVVDWILDQPLARAGREWDNRVLCHTERERLSRPVPDLVVTAPTRHDLVRVTVALEDPWSPEADTVVKQLNDLVLAGWQGFWLTSPLDRGSVLTRLDLGERLCAETTGLVVVDGPASSLDDLAAGVATARADLVCPLPSSSEGGSEAPMIPTATTTAPIATSNSQGDTR